MLKNPVFILLGALALSGCSAFTTEDKYSESYISSHIVKGKTTKAEVQALYGSPDSTLKTSSSTSWIYERNGTLKEISNLTSYIPGVNPVSTAAGRAQYYSGAASSAQKISNKISGDAVVTGNRIYFNFNENNDTVKSWNIYD